MQQPAQCVQTFQMSVRVWAEIQMKIYVLNWALDSALWIGNHIRRINGGDVNGERGHTYNHPSLFSMQSLTHPLPISISAASPSLTPTFPLTTLPSRQPLPKDQQAQHIPSFHISTRGPGWERGRERRGEVPKKNPRTLAQLSLQPVAPAVWPPPGLHRGWFISSNWEYHIGSKWFEVKTVGAEAGGGLSGAEVGRGCSGWLSF